MRSSTTCDQSFMNSRTPRRPFRILTFGVGSSGSSSASAYSPPARIPKDPGYTARIWIFQTAPTTNPATYSARRIVRPTDALVMILDCVCGSDGAQSRDRTLLLRLCLSRAPAGAEQSTGSARTGRLEPSYGVEFVRYTSGCPMSSLARKQARLTHALHSARHGAKPSGN